MKLAVNVSFFIDRLFIYDETRSNRARNSIRFVYLGSLRPELL